MATKKQTAARRKNIKKAQKARWGGKPHKTGKVRRPIDRVSVPLNKIKTLI